MLYSFQGIGLLPPWLSLLRSIVFSLVPVVNSFLNFLLELFIVNGWKHYRFLCLDIYLAALLNSLLLGNSLVLCCVHVCICSLFTCKIMWTEKILLLLQFRCLLFLHLAYLLQVELSRLSNESVIIVNLVLFLFLKGKCSVFHYWIWC